MSYNSDRIDPRLVSQYIKILRISIPKSLTVIEKLAYAAAFEQVAIEIRQDAAEVNRAAKNEIV